MKLPWGAVIAEESEAGHVPKTTAVKPPPRDIRQMAAICPSCGQSWWTAEGHCNICGQDRREEIDKELRVENASQYDRT